MIISSKKLDLVGTIWQSKLKNLSIYQNNFRKNKQGCVAIPLNCTLQFVGLVVNDCNKFVQFEFDGI